MRLSTLAYYYDLVAPVNPLFGEVGKLPPLRTVVPQFLRKGAGSGNLSVRFDSQKHKKQTARLRKNRIPLYSHLFLAFTIKQGCSISGVWLR